MRPYLCAVLALSLLALGGCATNPVTGRNELSLVSEAWELQVGAQQYAPARQSQGGDYLVDPEVQAYVSEVGQKLAGVSDRQLPYEFTVLNSSVPNAWALPGGKIAINRGLLNELRSEGELAAVLGHEIVHAAARHGAQGMQRGMLLQGAVLGAAIATQGSPYSNLAQLGASVGAQLISTRYGREAEREADYYGMLYMSRAGYDPASAIGLQETFVRLNENRRQDFLSGLFASHPPSQERVNNNRARAAELPAGGEVGEDRYQARIRTLVDSKPAYDAYDKAQQALADNKPREARTLIDQAIRLEPREGHFYSLRGDIAQQERNWQAALRDYQQAIARNDAFFYYYLQRGLVHERQRDYRAARADLERSVELLPTANGYNALGNIARADNDLARAKEYYARAAGSDSPAGSAALGSLLELDLPVNPGQYLQTRHRVDASGRIDVQIANATPRNITGIVIAYRYPDSAGRVRQQQQRLAGVLAAGQATIVSLPVTIDPAQAQLLEVGVVGAELAR